MNYYDDTNILNTVKQNQQGKAYKYTNNDKQQVYAMTYHDNNTIQYLSIGDQEIIGGANDFKGNIAGKLHKYNNTEPYIQLMVNNQTLNSIHPKDLTTEWLQSNVLHGQNIPISSPLNPLLPADDTPDSEKSSPEKKDLQQMKEDEIAALEEDFAMITINPRVPSKTAEARDKQYNEDHEKINQKYAKYEDYSSHVQLSELKNEEEKEESYSSFTTERNDGNSQRAQKGSLTSKSSSMSI